MKEQLNPTLTYSRSWKLGFTAILKDTMKV